MLFIWSNPQIVDIEYLQRNSHQFLLMKIFPGHFLMHLFFQLDIQG